MEKVDYRKAEAGDLDFLDEMYSSAVKRMNDEGIFQWDSSYPNRRVLEEDIERGQMWVGEQEGRIVSAYVLNRHSDDENKMARWEHPELSYIIVHRLCVNPMDQGKRLAEHAMRSLETYLREIGIKAVRIDTVSQNVPAVSLYRKLGYKLAGEDVWQSGSVYFFEKYL